MAHGTQNLSDILIKSTHAQSNLANMETWESWRLFLSNGLNTFGRGTAVQERHKEIEPRSYCNFILSEYLWSPGKQIKLKHPFITFSSDVFIFEKMRSIFSLWGEAHRTISKKEFCGSLYTCYARLKTHSDNSAFRFPNSGILSFSEKKLV